MNAASQQLPVTVARRRVWVCKVYEHGLKDGRGWFVSLRSSRTNCLTIYVRRSHPQLPVSNFSSLRLNGANSSPEIHFFEVLFLGGGLITEGPGLKVIPRVHHFGLKCF